MAYPHLQDLQKDPDDLKKCRESPVYFYNKYIRKEGEKVLTGEEFTEFNKQHGQKHTRAKILLTQIEKSIDKDATTGT